MSHAEYRIRRSDRARRARLTVTERGEVVVVLPQRVPLGEAKRLVVEHAAWLDRHVTRLRDEQARLRERLALGAGRPVLLEGELVTVWLADGPANGREKVDSADGRLLVRPGARGQGLEAVLQAWLRALARERLVERVAAHAPELGVRVGRLSVRDQRSRWGSASARGDLSFSWRLVLAPPFVLDAVVVHELAHLRLRGHTREFWALVEQHAPRTPEARRWLRQHARELRAALV